MGKIKVIIWVELRLLYGLYDIYSWILPNTATMMIKIKSHVGMFSSLLAFSLLFSLLLSSLANFLIKFSFDTTYFKKVNLKILKSFFKKYLHWKHIHQQLIKLQDKWHQHQYTMQLQDKIYIPFN